jgi:peptidoglycan/xylan/chitin deacetylase (PgdA/CDA1 family)
MARWQPSPFLYASAAIHTGAAAALLASPGSGPLLVGGVSALLANHLALASAGLLPRCQWLGPVLTRLPVAAGDAVAITIDDGPDPEVTPRVLDLLDAHGALATFFVVGEQARRHAALTREIAARGHAVENHSEHHLKTFSLRGPRYMAQEIDACRRSIADLTGLDSRFFRAPAGLRNPFLDPLLAHRDLTLAAWTRRAYDTRCADPERVLARLSRGLAARDILLLHDGHAARTADGTPVILEVLPCLLDTLSKAGLRAGRLATDSPN